MNYIKDEEIKLLFGLVNWSQRCDRVRKIINDYNSKGVRIKDFQIIESSDFNFPKRNHQEKWKNKYKWFNVGTITTYVYSFIGVKK